MVTSAKERASSQAGITPSARYKNSLNHFVHLLQAQGGSIQIGNEEKEKCSFAELSTRVRCKGRMFSHFVRTLTHSKSVVATSVVVLVLGCAGSTLSWVLLDKRCLCSVFSKQRTLANIYKNNIYIYIYIYHIYDICTYYLRGKTPHSEDLPPTSLRGQKY